MKNNTVALVISLQEGAPALVETLCEDAEIQFLESALATGEGDPLPKLYELREQVVQQENEFEDYVEALLVQPFLSPDIQNHGVEWFKSRIKIMQYQKIEREAAKTIAEYAFRVFKEDPSKTDFFLATHKMQVRIRVFTVSFRN